MVKTTKKFISNAKSMRKVLNAENYSKEQQQGIINLYEALVPGDDKRPIDINMIATEAFLKFEETIGKKEFEKVKKYFGIKGGKLNAKSAREFEVRSLVAKLRTIENAQYYIFGYKKLVKDMASKLLNAPKEMTDLEKAKVIRMFFILLANNEIFLEDYAYKVIGGKQKIVFDEAKALSNNKLLLGPEEMFDMYSMKVIFSDGYYYDMMIIHFRRMYLDYQETKNKYQTELVELLEFSELKYDGEKFTSVNKCMPGATFGKIRQLKQKIHQVHGMYPMEMFCNKKMITEKLDVTDLYIIYKSLAVIYPWKTEEKMKKQKYRTLSGSRFIDKEQPYYEVFENFLIADEAEAERWEALFEYLAEKELILSTEFDGNGGKLPKTKSYNMGVLVGALNYAMGVGYIDASTMVIRDFEVANKLLAIKDAKKNFLKFKRNEVSILEMRELLGIDSEFENNILQIKKVDENTEIEEAAVPSEKQEVVEVNNDVDDSLVQTVIKFALNNGYAESEANINMNLIENVIIPGNEDNIKKFSKGEIKLKEFEKKLGFEAEFAEAYFNTSKIDIKEVEAKLQDIKRYGKKEQIGKSKLLIALYCYLVKNGIGCGPKNKPVKRNKGLKPEILEKLIAYK